MRTKAKTPQFSQAARWPEIQFDVSVRLLESNGGQIVECEMLRLA
jgi:hypothetical protein